MITDLLQVETYLGRMEAVLSLDTVLEKFGQTSVASALTDQCIELRSSPCHTYVLLTDKGRMRAGC